MFALGSRLQQRIEGYDEYPARGGNSNEIGEDPPMRWITDECAEPDECSGTLARRARQPEIDRKQPDAAGSPRHAARAQLAAEEPVAEQRAERDPDRKQRQEQRHTGLLRAENEADVAREFRQVDRTDEPEPRDPEYQTERHGLACDLPDYPIGGRRQTPARLARRRCRAGRWYPAA